MMLEFDHVSPQAEEYVIVLRAVTDSGVDEGAILDVVLEGKRPGDENDPHALRPLNPDCTKGSGGK